MRTPSPSDRERRTLAAGAVVIASLVIVGRGLPAVRRWDVTARDAGAELAGEVARAEWSVAGARATAALRAEREAAIAALDSTLVSGSTPSASGAALAELVGQAARVAEATLAAVQLRPAHDSAGTFARVAVSAEVTGDLNTIALFLSALEEGPERLSVTELLVSQTDPSVPPNRTEVLHAEVLVEGLARVAVHETAAR